MIFFCRKKINIKIIISPSSKNEMGEVCWVDVVEGGDDGGGVDAAE